MGHARGAIHLVHRADAHPQHVRYGGRPVVGFDNDTQAIGQGELLDLRRGLRGLDIETKHQGSAQQKRWRAGHKTL